MQEGKGDIRGRELVCVVIREKIGRRLRCDLCTGIPVLLSLPLVERDREEAKSELPH